MYSWCHYAQEVFGFISLSIPLLSHKLFIQESNQHMWHWIHSALSDHEIVERCSRNAAIICEEFHKLFHHWPLCLEA